MPVTAIAPPTGVKSNIVKGVPVNCSRIEAMMILGGVPINVIIPPNIDPKASGISSIDGERPALAADCNAAGMSIASAPTLFINEDKAPATPDNEPIWAVGDLSGGIRRRDRMFTAPEFTNPRLAIKTSATVTVAGLANPENALVAVTWPPSVAASRARIATKSCRSLPHINRPKMMASRQSK